MYSRSFCRNLEEHIRNCNPSSDKERELLKLITEGMSLIAKDSPHVLNYDYASEKERDFEPPPLEYQILLTYSITDTVTKDMESCFSTDCQETYNQTPVSFTFITPETEKLFRPENYLERFSKWFEKFRTIQRLNRQQKVYVAFKIPFHLQSPFKSGYRM